MWIFFIYISTYTFKHTGVMLRYWMVSNNINIQGDLPSITEEFLHLSSKTFIGSSIKLSGIIAKDSTSKKEITKSVRYWRRYPWRYTHKNWRLDNLLLFSSRWQNIIMHVGIESPPPVALDRVGRELTFSWARTRVDHLRFKFYYNRVKVDLLHKCVFFTQHYPLMPTTMSKLIMEKGPLRHIHSYL